MCLDLWPAKVSAACYGVNLAVRPFLLRGFCILRVSLTDFPNRIRYSRAIASQGLAHQETQPHLAPESVHPLKPTPSPTPPAPPPPTSTPHSPHRCSATPTAPAPPPALSPPPSPQSPPPAQPPHPSRTTAAAPPSPPPPQPPPPTLPPKSRANDTAPSVPAGTRRKLVIILGTPPSTCPSSDDTVSAVASAIAATIAAIAARPPKATGVNTCAADNGIPASAATPRFAATCEAVRPRRASAVPSDSFRRRPNRVAQKVSTSSASSGHSAVCSPGVCSHKRRRDHRPGQCRSRRSRPRREDHRSQQQTDRRADPQRCVMRVPKLPRLQRHPHRRHRHQQQQHRLRLPAQRGLVRTRIGTLCFAHRL